MEQNITVGDPAAFYCPWIGYQFLISTDREGNETGNCFLACK